MTIKDLVEKMYKCELVRITEEDGVPVLYKGRKEGVPEKLKNREITGLYSFMSEMNIIVE